MATLFLNGRIRTLGPTGVTDAMLVREDGTVEALGEAARSHPLAASAHRHDLGGRTALPGPVDAHVHLLWHAQADMQQADLFGAASVDDVLERLSAHAAKRAEGWVLGHGFDQERFPDHAFPTRHDLDRISTSRPIYISRMCGHAVVGNTRALEMAGIASETGVLMEDRADPLNRVIPEPDAAEWVEIAAHAMDLLARSGFTGCHLLLDTKEQVAAMQTLHRRGGLKGRVRLQVRYPLLPHLEGLGLSTGFGDDWLSLGCVKIFSDGAMGPSTAALTEDYTDGPGNRGEFIYPQETLERMCREVHEAGCQLAIHAIGDAAMDASMDAIVYAAGAETAAARHRIEHASIVRPDQVARLAETGILCCVQPQFIVSDFWTVQRLGEARKPWIYPFATMWKAGVHLSGGTDCPVERFDALEAIGRAVVRDAPWRGNGIGEGYLEDERLTPEQAWHLFTTGSAHAGFREDRWGTLEPGMQADFIALDEDPFTADPKSIETMTPALSAVAGRVMYEATP